MNTKILHNIVVLRVFLTSFSEWKLSYVCWITFYSSTTFIRCAKGVSFLILKLKQHFGIMLQNVLFSTKY